MSFPDAPSYGASSQSRATNNNKFPSEGPRVMQVRVDFTAAGQSAEIDLTIEQQQKQISQVQGLWINNTDGPNLLLVSEVTNQRVNIAAGAQGYIQLLSQNPPRFSVTSAAIATVDFFFLNFPVIHSVNAPSGGGGIQSIVAGTNITVDNTDPANPVVSASGGGGGGGGKVQYTSILKTSAGAQITGADISGAAFTPFVLTTQAAVTLVPGSAINGNFLCLFQSYAGGGTTISCDSGAYILDKSGSAVGSIACPQFETVQLMFQGDGAGNNTVQVIDRY